MYLPAVLVLLTTALPTLSFPLLTPRQESCPPLELVFARGTGEVSRLGIIGQPLGSGLKKAIPGATSIGVDYPATDFTASPEKGAKWVAEYVTKKASQCPGTKFVIGGYSQGAMVVHRAAPKLKGLEGKIIASTVFGDPNRQWGAFMGGKTFPVPDQKGDVFDVCGTSDFVCGSDRNGPKGSHMSYVTNGSVQKAVEFVVGRYQAKAAAAA